MKQDTFETPMLFRRSKNGEITAIIPTEPADIEGRYMLCYAHVGQHDSCSAEWLATTRPATPSEYADLLAELESIGYRVRVYLKRTPKHRAAFESHLQAWRSIKATP